MRKPRQDHPGAWWHITNRGIAKRAVFETALDVERFLEALAVVVELGLLEVHAYSILTTHFHLLVRSVTGEVSEAMRQVANRFVRWFNRSRRRDGPLFRGRFCGRRIDDWVYWETVVRYVDLNPVRAGMCDLPSDHAYGSAQAYRTGGPPGWLARGEVERTLRGFFEPDAYDPERYDEFAAACDPVANAHLMDRLLVAPSAPAPAFADLVRAASIPQQSWMEWKTALADGATPGTAFVSPESALRAAEAGARILRRRPMPERADRSTDLRVALLHRAAGLNMQEVAGCVALSKTSVYTALRRHDQRMADNPAYAELAARILRKAVKRSIPLPSHPLALPARVAAGPDGVLVATNDGAWNERSG